MVLEHTSHADDFSDRLGLIYESSLNPDIWPYALEALCAEFNADKAQLLFIHPEEFTFSFACGFGFDPYDYDIGASRFRRYLIHDPVALYALEHAGEVFSDRRVINPDVLHQSPMQIDIRDPANMEYLLTVYLTEENLDGTAIIFFRGKEQAPFGVKEEEGFSRYLSHIKRATKIQKNLTGSKQVENLQLAVLNQLKWGIIVLDDKKNIMLCNDTGKRIIDNNENILIRNNRLVCLKKSEQDLLNHSVSNILEGFSENKGIKKIAIKIGSSVNSSSIFIVTTPLNLQKFEDKKDALLISQPHYTAKLPNRRFALITLCDPNQNEQCNEILKVLFGLTQAESALVNKLADDCSIQEAASSLGRTVGTARIQLQSVFEKTGTNRQSSLVRLLMSIPT